MKYYFLFVNLAYGVNKMKTLSGLLMIICLSCQAQVREPAVAGSFYPADREELGKTLEMLFSKVSVSEFKDQQAIGLLVPHAGYIYSGEVAAAGFALLSDSDYDTVVLLGSSHHYYRDIIALDNSEYYQTPLGKIPLDLQIIQNLTEGNKRIRIDREMHLPEHSLEVELPFLQQKLVSYKIIPVLTSTRDITLLKEFADHLFEVLNDSGRKPLFICSSDMSHYHDYNSAVKMDRHTIDLILEQNVEQLRSEYQSQKCELCGFYAYLIFQRIMEHYQVAEPVLLSYRNSGDALGDTSANRVVGYCSVAYFATRKTEKEILEGAVMKPEDKDYLLNLARKSIENYLSTKKILTPDPPDNPLLNEQRAVFVTLSKNGDLRGCIGHMEARMPVYQAVVEMATAAAFNDYRFSPLGKEELKQIEIEISILSPLKKIDDPEQIRLGIDGVWIKKGYHSGVFLPQVAAETGWDKQTFLESLCAHKAGLPKNAYLDPDTEIFIYQVDKFREE